MRRRAPVQGRPGLGLLLLAVGRQDGFAAFGGSVEAYLGSLAPLIAFALVSGGVAMLSGKWRLGLTGLLVSIVGTLAPPVIAHPLCRRWGKEARWALYANLLNWGQILMGIVLSLAAVVAQIASRAGVPALAATLAAAGCALLYSIWLQWFLARGALRLSRGRTLVLLLVTLLGTYALIVGPLAAGRQLPDLVAFSAPPGAAAGLP